MTRLIGTLLLGIALAWFAPFLECQFFLLNNFEAFFEEFGASFGDSDKERTTISKL
jgi:hypothetical protein